MSRMNFQKAPSRTLVALTVGLIAAARGQSIQFPGELAPVISAPTVQAVDGSGRPGTVVDTSTGRQFVASYDASSRLSSLKATAGRNALNLDAITYFPDGRVAIVTFGNRYELIFRYRSDGTQEIVDPLGGTIVRSQTGPGQFVTQSAVDPSGFLALSLRLLEALLSRFGPVPGLASS
jgi:hypothetical protein